MIALVRTFPGGYGGIDLFIGSTRWDLHDTNGVDCLWAGTIWHADLTVWWSSGAI